MPTVGIHKFGGTSVADAQRLKGVVDIVRAQRETGPIAVVASAGAGVTDQLVRIARDAAEGRQAAWAEVVDALRARHLATLADLGGDPATGAEIERLIAEAHDLATGSTLFREMTLRARDRLLAVGEKLSVRLLALACRKAGFDAVAVDADTFLETDGQFGEATPLGSMAERAIRGALAPIINQGHVPIVTGFIGRAPDGATTTLGRGGSDLSATVLAAGLAAAEVVLWSDVAGVLSADPRLVPTARMLEQLHYREAAELSYYGAKVLHPRTMIPIVKRGIPVWSRSTFAPKDPGTVIDGRFTPGSHPVKAISAVRGQALLSLEGNGLSGVPGVASRCFTALAREGISITMISQCSSESTICMAVPQSDADRAEQTLKREFRPELARGHVEDVVTLRGVALVAAVGHGMAHMPGIAGRIFTALGRRRTNVLAIAQGSSELNVSLAVNDADVEGALRALHDEFRLGLRDTGEDAPPVLDVILIGAGGIGRSLVRQMTDRREHMRQRFGVTPRVVGMADRSGYLFEPRGLKPDRLDAALAAKASGRAFADLPDSVRSSDAIDLLRHALSHRLSRPVVVDVSDSDGSARLFAEAFQLGADVVSANKKPLAGDLTEYEALVAAARQHGRLLRVEATVGAGLPVMDTLQMLLGAGDRMVRAEGCLSGTLAFVTSSLDAGMRFSEAVAEAAKRGYTEPDPVVDLSGQDVLRKAIILGRVSGVLDANAPIRLTPLVDPSLGGRPLPRLLDALKALDATFAARVEAARQRGAVLRYLARVDASGIDVRLADVPADSPLGALRGTDNMIVFQTERYHDRPLVISGPGAGIDVTAMGVLGDLMRIAAERRQA
jgi:bifunctional aspartokinase / homoserine dehydrogenase 1